MRARNRYLLRLHLRVAIDILHLPVHLWLGGAVGGGLSGLDLRGIHIRLLAVVLLRCEAVTECVVGRGHGRVAWVAGLLDVLLRDLTSTSGRHAGGRCLSWRALL